MTIHRRACILAFAEVYILSIGPAYTSKSVAQTTVEIEKSNFLRKGRELTVSHHIITPVMKRNSEQ